MHCGLREDLILWHFVMNINKLNDGTEGDLIMSVGVLLSNKDPFTLE